MYYEYGVKLSEGHRKKLAKAIKDKSEITIRLTKGELTGGDEMLLTKTQVNKLQKAQASG